MNHVDYPMSLNKVIYITEGYFGTRAANSIQVKCMADAFENNRINVNIICRGVNSNVPLDKFRIKVIKGPLILYRIKVIIMLLFKQIDNNTFIYGRSFVIQHFISLFGICSILELHKDELEIPLKRFLFIISNKKIIKYLGISKSIFYSKFWTNKNKFVLHDGHNNYNKKIKVNKVNQIIKVGYFGKLSKRKGLNTLLYIDMHLPKQFQLNIFSADHEKKSLFKNINNIEWINRDNIFNKMSEMDILLLPISKVDHRDYSRYTSPLKLFEYASCGKIILYSPVESLNELNLPVGFYKCNDYSEWIQKLNEIKNDNIYRNNKILNNIFHWSKDYTWDNRAKKIIDYAIN